MNNLLQLATHEQRALRRPFSTTWLFPDMRGSRQVRSPSGAHSVSVGAMKRERDLPSQQQPVQQASPSSRG
jgi:hypothetical protein